MGTGSQAGRDRMKVKHCVWKESCQLGHMPGSRAALTSPRAKLLPGEKPALLAGSVCIIQIARNFGEKPQIPSFLSLIPLNSSDFYDSLDLRLGFFR